MSNYQSSSRVSGLWSKYLQQQASELQQTQVGRQSINAIAYNLKLLISLTLYDEHLKKYL